MRYTRRSWSVLAMVLAGCTGNSMPLTATPISGAAPEVETEIRLVLRTFETSVGQDRVSVPEIRVAPNASLGSIDRRSLRVTLDESISVEDVSWVLRHELCHALDFTEGLVERGDLSFFDDVADGLFAEGMALEADYASGSLRRSEAMATFCSLGPLAAEALQERCGEEAKLGATTFGWLDEHVWQNAPPLSEAAGPSASHSVLTPVDVVVASPTTSPPDGLRLRLGRYDGSAVDFFEDVVVDDTTGEVLDVLSGDAIEVEPSRDVGVKPDYETLYEIASGWADGQAATVANFSLYHLGESEFRLFLRPAEVWQAAEPTCGLISPTLFNDESRLGVAWAGSNAVQWRWLSE